MGSATGATGSTGCSSAAAAGLSRQSRRAWLGAAVAHCIAAVAWVAAPRQAAAQGAGSNSPRGAASSGGAPAAPGVPAGGGGKTLLVVGDSLSAEYGLARGQGWVALLEQRVARERLGYRVMNASISGDTTSGGRSRLPQLLREHRPQVVVIELGGNDALRGLPIAMTESNLVEMTRTAKAGGAHVLLAGITVPPNYGRSYGEAFLALFPKVARAEGAALVPFILAGVADAPDAEAMFQPDRIHPRAEAHPRILETMWAALRPLLK
ncbi:MAG: arylesterase [Rubrivivax sp.]|nr:arylesterase [Rubrivivax sp.]